MDVDVNVKKYSDIVYAMGFLFILYMPILAASHDFARIIRDAGVELVALIGIVFTFWQNVKLIYSPQKRGNYILSLTLMLIIWLVGMQYWLGYGEIFNNIFLY